MTSDTPDPAVSPAKSARLPIVMSAVVYPGVGQFMQRRWTAAIVYAVSFSVLIALSFWLVIREFIVLLHAFEQVIETGVTSEMHALELRPILKAGGISMLIYLANVYDVWLAYHRQAIARRNTGS